MELEQFYNLQTLDISSNPIKKINLNMFNSLSSLTKLNMSNIDINNIDIEKIELIFAPLIKLEG